MARRHYTSTFADTTLVGTISNSATSINVTSATGAPAVPFPLVLDPGLSSEEMVDVTAVAGTVLTVTRAVDGTTGVSHSNGAVVRHAHSARDFDEPNAHVNASAAVHGLSGTVVGTTDTQTLSAKTLTTPIIGSFVNAGHDHLAAAGGGTLSLLQSQTHQSPDTDAATTSLHHTVGAGATQAAAGNHTHSPSFGSPTALTTATTGSDGVASTESRSDHRHAFPPEVPRGRMGRAAITSGSATFTNTVVDISGLSVTFTAVSTRFYRLTFCGLVGTDTANDTVDITITDASNNTVKDGRVRLTAAGGPGQTTLTIAVEVSGISGSVTYKIRGNRSAGSGNCSVAALSTNPAEIFVDDTGGV